MWCFLKTFEMVWPHVTTETGDFARKNISPKRKKTSQIRNICRWTYDFRRLKKKGVRKRWHRRLTYTRLFLLHFYTNTSEIFHEIWNEPRKNTLRIHAVTTLLIRGEDNFSFRREMYLTKASPGGFSVCVFKRNYWFFVQPTKFAYSRAGQPDPLVYGNSLFIALILSLSLALQPRVDLKAFFYATVSTIDCVPLSM